MNTNHAQLLERLLEAVPEGFLVDTDWMTGNGFGRECLPVFLGGGWLEGLDSNVYRRPSEGNRPGVVGWKICLLSLQHVMGREVHIGGATALAMIAFADQKFLDPKVGKFAYSDSFPSWLERLPLDTSLETRARNLLDDPVLGVRKLSMKQWLPWDWTIRVSTPERAILEALDEFPNGHNIPLLDGMFRGLSVLHSELMVELLRNCRKYEVKKLFFAFGDKYDHAWRKAIDPAEFDLGTRDLAIMQDEYMQPHHNIAVSSPFAQPEESQ